MRNIPAHMVIMFINFCCSCCFCFFFSYSPHTHYDNFFIARPDPQDIWQFVRYNEWIIAAKIMIFFLRSTKMFKFYIRIVPNSVWSLSHIESVGFDFGVIVVKTVMCVMGLVVRVECYVLFRSVLKGIQLSLVVFFQEVRFLVIKRKTWEVK